MKRQRLPDWLINKTRGDKAVRPIKQLLRTHNLHTVCEEARCPNIGECFERGTATFLIMGSICTRNCHFCAVETGVPKDLDPQEPERVAEAVQKMNLTHVVITSVTRDDLEDGGAGHYQEVIDKIKGLSPKITVEALIPDLKGSHEQLYKITCSRLDILNHNIETVPRLYPDARPQANYKTSIKILEQAKNRRPQLLTKSGLMVGLGETKEEVIEVMTDLISAGCDILTIGQYLQPAKSNLPVSRYYHPDEFEDLKLKGLQLGFKQVHSGPLVRSSYKAGV